MGEKVIGLMALHLCGGSVVLMNRMKILINVWIKVKKIIPDPCEQDSVHGQP